MAVSCFVTASSMGHSSIPTVDTIQNAGYTHSSARNAPKVFCRSVRFALSLFFFYMVANVCQAQSREVVCKNGIGEFDAVFHTGVEVRVGAARNGELATRVCEGTINWERQKLVVEPTAAQIDVDAFGVDLGLPVQVATLQVKKTSDECCMEYRIYSLRKPLRLLRKITGGSFFSAADTDLDGRVEIWTDDTAAVDGFEHIPLSSLDSAPPVVLRFERGRLLDVGAEFQSDYDRQIESARAAFDAQDLREFKESDGILAPAVTFSEEALHLRQRLQTVKIKILEIVWLYLYSGREEEARRTLTDLWPIADAERIRGAIWAARARGILKQTEGVSKGVRAGGKPEARVYEGLLGLGNKPEVSVLPQPILLLRAPPEGKAAEVLASTEVRLILVLDSAGKVRSATPEDRVDWADAGLKASVASWKFIPAFKNGQAVASRIGYAVSLRK